MSDRIPIGDARRIAEERHYPMVVLLGLTTDGKYCLTSYGQTRKLCQVAELIAHALEGELEGVMDEVEERLG